MMLRFHSIRSFRTCTVAYRTVSAVKMPPKRPASDEATADAAGKPVKRAKAAPSAHAGPPEFSTGEYQAVSKLADMNVAPKSLGAQKVLCWNVNGFRAMVKREGADALLAYLKREDADILALQEIKIDADGGAKQAAALLAPLYPYADFACCTAKGGYAGVATFSKVKPSLVSKDLPCLPEENSGRVVTSSWSSGSGSGGAGSGSGSAATSSSTASTATGGEGLPFPLTLVNVYVPNSGMKLERLDVRTGTWDPAFRSHVAGLLGSSTAAGAGAGASSSGAGAGAGSEASSTPASLNGGNVLILGDLNVAYHDMDVHTPSTNRNKTPGFCDGERDGFKALLDTGLSDVWREQNPTLQQFTYWSARFNCRAQNKGWRLDYALVSESLKSRVKSVSVRANFPGTDHVPIAIELA